MGSSVSKYLEKLTEKVNNAGHFGANAKQLEKVMSDREIMNAKGGLKVPKKKIQDLIDDETNQIIAIFEEEYPELSNEFQDIQDEMYEMFARKHMDYGLNNIALGGDLTNKFLKRDILSVNLIHNPVNENCLSLLLLTISPPKAMLFKP